MSKRCLIVVNPISGRLKGRRVAARLAEGLGERGVEAETISTEAPGDGRQAAEQADPGEVSAILCAGGDGTVNEVVNGLAGKGIPVALFPTGTGNVLAKEFGIRAKADAVCDAVAAGQTVELALGEVNGRRFVLFVGGGFDAAVARRFEQTRNGPVSKLSYLLPILHVLFRYPCPDIHVTVDGEPVGSSPHVLVANVRSYGGPFVMVPDAAPTADVLDICLISGKSRPALIRRGWAAFRHRLLNHHGVRHVQGRTITLRADGLAPFQVDGDFFGCDDLTVRMIDDRLTFIVPPTD